VSKFIVKPLVLKKTHVMRLYV